MTPPQVSLFLFFLFFYLFFLEAPLFSHNPVRLFEISESLSPRPTAEISFTEYMSHMTYKSEVETLLGSPILCPRVRK